MDYRYLAVAAIVLSALVPCPPFASAPPANTPASAPLTAWGAPDLQGVRS